LTPRSTLAAIAVDALFDTLPPAVLATIVIRLKLHRKMRNRSPLIGYPERGRN